MRVEVIQDNANFFCFGPMDSHHLAHTSRKVLFGTPSGHFHMPPTGQGLQKDEQVAAPFSLVFIVIANWFSRLKW